MAERRTISTESPGIELEIELDPGLEDTVCIACLQEGRRRSARGCPHDEAARAAAALESETQQVAQLAARTPRSRDVLFAGLRWALGRRPWWATSEGRKRKREQLEREARERER